MMYLGGLEVRLLVDETSPRTEKKLILAEAQRLLQIYGNDEYAKIALTQFIGIAKLILGLKLEVEPTTERKHPNYDAVLARLGKLAVEGTPLKAVSLLNWYLVAVNTPESVVRVFPEFKAMFTALFDEQYPNGMEIDEPYRERLIHYRPAGGYYPIDLFRHVGFIADVRELREPLAIARKIAAKASSSLNKYRRFIQQNPRLRNQFDAYLLLPIQIREEFPNDTVDEIRLWAHHLIQNKQVVRFREAAKRFEFANAESVTRSQTIKIIDALAGMGIGLAPDPRFTKYSLKLDDTICLYEHDHAIPRLSELGDEYWNIFRRMAVTCFVIQARDRIAQSDLDALEKLIFQYDKLEPYEIYLLLMNRTWMLKVMPTLPMLRQNIKAISPSEKQQLASLALKMSVINNHVPMERVEAVSKLYKLFGLDVANVYSDLHSHTFADATIAVTPSGEAVQSVGTASESSNDGMVELDSERINSVLSDTVRVSAVLGEIFEDDSHAGNGESELADGLLPGLDQQHALMALELIQRNYWNDEEFEALAGRFSLMPGGALEILNEWAFEYFQEPLMEEYDGYNLNSAIVEKIESI